MIPAPTRPGVPRPSTDHIFIHCSATPPTMDIGALKIDEWHRKRNWRCIGYHFVIRRTGVIEIGRPLSEVGAHVRGWNSKSVGLCMVGGIDRAGQPENNFTEDQWQTLNALLFTLEAIYPGAEIKGHNEVAAKACPSFHVQNWLTQRRGQPFPIIKPKEVLQHA